AALAALAWRAGSLKPSGAVAACGVATAILAGTGIPGGIALLVFFAGGSAAGRLTPDPAIAMGARGGRRDAWQVLSNGGPAAAGAMMTAGLTGAGLWIVTVSLAAAAADTWASGVGALSRNNPVDLLGGRQVPPGTSGGVTTAGTLGGLAGAVSVAAAGAAFGGGIPLFLAAAGLGFIGMVADSAIGSAFQGRFRCPRCDAATERRVHTCGTRATRTGGLPWLNNDGVNAVTTALAALAGWLAWVWA
ncbi:MAG: DUF92 domain-containing protein, partial [Gemmatimonadales bacterium]